MSKKEMIEKGLTKISTGNHTMIAIHKLIPHPKNSEIFPANDREQEELNASVKLHGVQVPIVVNMESLHGDWSEGMCTVISGHRRLIAAKTAGITEVPCDCRTIKSETEELLLLCALNVGRGFKDVYKIRLFKASKQFLYQLRVNPDLMRSAKDVAEEYQSLVYMSYAAGVKITKGVKTWKILQALFGFSEREQKALTWLADDDYREEMLATLAGVKGVKKSVIDDVRAKWVEVEKKALSEELPLKKAIKVVESYKREIEDFIAGKEKPAKKPIAEKPEKISVAKPFTMSFEAFEKRFGFLDGEISLALDGSEGAGECLVVSLAGENGDNKYVAFPTDYLKSLAQKVSK